VRWADRLRTRVARAIAPSAGSRRASHFSGAAYNRLLADWASGIFSPNTELLREIRTLRARARSLAQNDGYCSGFCLELANNVVGPNGILLQAQVRDTEGNLDKDTNQALEDAWESWGDPEFASADQHDSFVDLEQLIIKTIAIDGECFVRQRRGFRNQFGYALQIVDADLLDETFNRPAASETDNEIVMGVELTPDGVPVQYWFWNRHPSEPGPKRRVPVPASDILHLFVRYRANQRRGVTWFAPVIITSRMLDGYMEAELVAARVGAASMGAIVNKDPNAVTAFTAPEDPGSASGEPVQRSFDAEPGTFKELLPGQELQMFDPKHPTTAFPDFTKAILRKVGRGLGVGYTTLTGDLEATNYSSGRIGLMSERDHWRSLQRWFSKQFHRPVYREWLKSALLNRQVAVDGYLAAAYRTVAWKPRGWQWVDPVNDLVAKGLAIALGLDSRMRVCAEQGLDFEDVIDEIAEELAYAADAGVDVGGTTAKQLGHTIPEDNSTDPATGVPAKKKAPAAAPADGSDDSEAAFAGTRPTERSLQLVRALAEVSRTARVDATMRIR
jgi:lambda family phage portal protein